MNSKLLYNKPADYWEEALPLGNGKMGAMVYGGIDVELIQLNHDTLWSGTVNSLKYCNKTEVIKKLREFINNRDYHKADEYFMQEFSCVEDAATYLPMGDIVIKRYDGSKISKYSRCLSLEDSEVTIKYNDNFSYKRTSFISYPHDVMVVDITSENKISLSVSVETLLIGKNISDEKIIGVKGCAAIKISKEIPNCEDIINFAYIVTPVVKNGFAEVRNNTLYIFDAERVTLYIACETNFVAYNKVPDKDKNLIELCENKANKAIQDGYETVRKRHIADYRSLYNKVSFDLDCNDNDVTTDQRIINYKTNPTDVGLVELLFNFGRYLMISGSRNGSQPLNLQGIWNNKIRPPWFSDYTTNINTEMNYWPAESCNLSSCHQPLLKMIEELSVAGEKTATKIYGCRGFVVHHNSDIWRKTDMAKGSPVWAMWPMSGAWLCAHLWQHFEYNCDIDYLGEKAYPIMKKCSMFFLDYLCMDENGYFVTNPSTSPENKFISNGEVCCISKMSTMDMSIIRELFSNLITASEILKIDDDVVERVRQYLPRLYPFKIGSNGQLLEWFEEFTESEMGHRHLSHLYGLYPANLISKETPELYNAAKKTLEIRLANGGGHTGWSCGWIINLYARLFDGENAKRYLDMLIKQSLYSNLFDAHPPFQIDGNFSFVSGIAEMLLQSTKKDGVYILNILPAKPKAWKNGSVKGLCAKGGFEVDITWHEDAIPIVNVISKCKNKYRLVY